ncbi:unnamed protein product [Ectocarpus sp. 8 AP-2014]
MDEIQELVRKVVRQCASRGVTVSEVLAAFVARTVIQKPGLNGQALFSLNSPLTQEGLSDLIDRSVDRLLEVDSPSLETMKMQVAVDSSYITEDEGLLNSHQRRSARLREMQRTIATMRPKDGADFDALTALHRQIFSYLLRHASDDSRLGRGVEREVAAALESVFPRISLKAFINLGSEEKYAQLDELANIVLGIRVFNQHIGKGGVNIPNPEQEAATLLLDMGRVLSDELEQAQQTCAELQQVIVHSELRHPQGVTADMLSRWKDELTNKRQYLSYLQSLQEDMAVSDRKVGLLRDTIRSEMRDLEELVGNRASVPKEHVYPKFYEIATHWTALYREYKVISGRTRTTDVLRAFRDSYTPTIRGGMDIQSGELSALEENARAAEAAVGITSTNVEPTGATENKPSLGDTNEGKDADEEGRRGDTSDHIEEQPGPGGQEPAIVRREDQSIEQPVKLSIESTPEFMQLPLEYQGFCSWTIVKRQGLLLPGKPELGVIRYKNRFFVFAHQVAIATFMSDPELFLKATLERAVASPELIHLLRLQDSFPETCISRMLQGGKNGNGKIRPSLALALPEKREAGTDTPVHFIEKCVDPEYHWNEWVLRRRALQVANLRNCVTKSQQTDGSHFRRVNDTQVYLPRAKHTQTNRNSGTKPPRHVQYFGGERVLSWLHSQDR